MDEKRCTTCHERRSRSEFNVRRSAPDGLQSRCRACSREWYLRNKAEHVRRVGERNKRVRAEDRERLTDYLLDHPCVDRRRGDREVLGPLRQLPPPADGRVLLLVAVLRRGTTTGSAARAGERPSGRGRRMSAPRGLPGGWGRR